MDVLVTLTNDGTISTDLYTKPTDTHQYLHVNSCHPNHVKKDLRFRRRHVFYVSVVTQPQRSLGVMNLSIIWCVVDMDGDVHNWKFNVR